MNSWKKGVGTCAIAFFLLLDSCGKNGDNSTSITPAANPANQPAQTLTTTTPATDPRLPDLSKSTELILDDSTNYSDLKTISQMSFQEVIGKTYLELNPGSMLLGFEDETEFWAASVPSVNLEDSRTSTSIDSIFADSQVIFHVTGQANASGQIAGSLTYYMRQSGQTACLPVTCQMCYTWGCVPATCDTATLNNAATQCRQFVNSNSFKEVGTYTVDPTLWIQ